MNKFKEMINRKEKPIGTFSEACSSYMVEATGYTGFDYIIIDNEHSPIEAETSLDMIKAAELSGITPICRVRETSRPAVLKLLDLGAQGIIVPYIKTMDEINNLVQWSKYKPIGDRGFSGSRKDMFGNKLNMSVADTMKYYNNEVLLIPQCETKEAYDLIEEIVNTDGVDGIFIGPYDLSIALDVPGDFESPVYKQAVKLIVEKTHEAGKFTIIYAGDVDKAIELFADGHDSITYCMDTTLYIDYAKKSVNEIRAKLKQ